MTVSMFKRKVCHTKQETFMFRDYLVTKICLNFYVVLSVNVIRSVMV